MGDEREVALQWPFLFAAVSEGRIDGRGLPTPGSRTLRCPFDAAELDGSLPNYKEDE